MRPRRAAATLTLTTVALLAGAVAGAPAIAGATVHPEDVGGYTRYALSDPVSYYRAWLATGMPPPMLASPDDESTNSPADGSDLRGAGIEGLRTPHTSSTNYQLSLQRIAPVSNRLLGPLLLAAAGGDVEEVHRQPVGAGPGAQFVPAVQGRRVVGGEGHLLAGDHRPRRGPLRIEDADKGHHTSGVPAARFNHVAERVDVLPHPHQLRN